MTDKAGDGSEAAPPVAALPLHPAASGSGFEGEGTMFGIDGLNPISMFATAAFGPLGGIVSQLATQVVSQLGQQLIGQLGQQMGLPQSAIDMAQGAFAESVGDHMGAAQNLDEAIEAFGQATGASPAQIGDAQNQAQKILEQTAKDASESDDAKDAKAGGKGGSWLLALAKALGTKMDGLADKMEKQSKNLDEGKPSDSAEFSATSQQFNMLMNASSNAIKTIGEALGNMARKQ
jgi:hypothetical protein